MNAFRVIVAHEWRMLRSSASTWVALGLLAMSILFGVANAERWAESRRESARHASASEAEAFSKLQGRLGSSDDAMPRPESAAHVGFTDRFAVLPPAPLAALAVGRSDVLPHQMKVTTRSLASSHIKAGAELGNPEAFVTSRFDTAFALVVVLPLVALVLLVDMVSIERERGTLALLLSQPIRPATLIVAKAGLRGVLVAAVAVIATLVGLGSVADRLLEEPQALLLAAFSIIAYAIFWVALATWVGSRGWSTSTNALALAGAFIAIVIVVPGITTSVSQTLRPVPSRARLVEAVRDAETSHRGRGESLLVEHWSSNPGTKPVDFDPSKGDFALFFTAIQGAVQRDVGPQLRSYDRALEARVRLADALAVVSPAAMMQGALEDLSGTSGRRHAAFLDQTATFHAANYEFFADRAFSQRALSIADYQARPRFAFEETAGGSRHALRGILVLLAFSLAFAGAAARGFSRPQVR